MNRTNAMAAVKAMFAGYRAATGARPPSLSTMSKGKLYELYVLSELTLELARRGFRLRFVGTTLKFKASPGMIDLADPHFEVASPNGDLYRIFVDIEFETYGSAQGASYDLSRRHEIDIVVTTAASGYPAHHEIALGIECKSHANFTKDIVKAALGVRRELSLLQRPSRSILSRSSGGAAIAVNAKPPSEFWLAFIDPKGQNYAASPATFSIDFRTIAP